MKEKLNMIRPEVGELSRLRIHETDRPKPVDQFYKKAEISPDVPPVSDLSKYPEAADSLKRTSRVE
jgi:hypothetical protein